MKGGNDQLILRELHTGEIAEKYRLRLNKISRIVHWRKEKLLSITHSLINAELAHHGWECGNVRSTFFALMQVRK